MKSYSLPQFSAIRLSGEKTAPFLQGQVTADVNALAVGDSTFSACCDHKGRVLSNFWIYREESDFLLVLPKAMQAILIKHLQKFAVFSKVKLQSETIDIAVFEDIERSKISHNRLITLPNPRRHLALGVDASPLEETWEHNNIEDKLPIIYPETSLLFTPQMLDLDKLNAISFNKGCYVGQEIIARTHYLGKLKRHLQRCQINTAQLPARGSDLRNEHQEKTGVIVSAIMADQTTADALAVIEDRWN